MLRPLLGICIKDETGSAMVILLPWCAFQLPDVTFCIAAVPWGWCGFSRLVWLKHGACTRSESKSGQTSNSATGTPQTWSTRGHPVGSAGKALTLKAEGVQLVTALGSI